MTLTHFFKKFSLCVFVAHGVDQNQLALVVACVEYIIDCLAKGREERVVVDYVRGNKNVGLGDVVER